MIFQKAYSVLSQKDIFEIKEFFDHHTLYLAWQLTMKEVKDVMQPLCLSTKSLHVRSFCNCYYSGIFKAAGISYTRVEEFRFVIIYSVIICICVASFTSYYMKKHHGSSVNKLQSCPTAGRFQGHHLLLRGEFMKKQLLCKNEEGHFCCSEILQDIKNQRWSSLFKSLI